MSRVIFIGNYPPPISGQSIAFKTLVHGYALKFKDIFVINSIEKSGKRGVIHRTMDYIGVTLELLYLLLFKKVDTVYHIVSSHKYGFIRDFVIINISYFFKKRIVLHSHNGNYDEFYDSCSDSFKRTIFKTVNKANKIIILSIKLRNTFYFISDDDKFSYVNNGLPIDGPKVLNKGSNDVFSILYLSNLIESKGYLDIIKCAVLMKEMEILSKFHFHFAGEFMLNPSQDKSYKSINEARQLFSNLIKENDLSDYITYHGVVQGEKKSSLLCEADIFLLPTYYNVEAQPITIIEALAFGCAIFSTNYRGIPEMLIDGFNGQYIDPNTPSDIAEKLKDLNRDQIRKYSKCSIELFDEHFTKEKHISRMLNLLCE